MLVSAWRPIAEGTPGIRDIVHQLRTLKEYYGTVPAMRAAALAIAGSTINNDQQGQVRRLAEFVRRAVVYQADPWGAEYVQTPDRLLLDIATRGQARGDCDDHVLLFASLCEALGVYAEIVGVIAPGWETWNHVIATAYPDDLPVDIDLCAKDGYQPVYEAKLQ